VANVLYTRFINGVMDGTYDLNSAGLVVRCLLVRSTSTYVPDPDHDFVSDATGAGLVEISVASYARQTVANKTQTADDTNNRAVWDFDDVSFGSLETGQTVLAYMLYVQTGGSDASPSDDVLIAYIDTVTAGLPAALGGGAFNIVISSNGFLWGRQAA
jgi:hypothetical protein